MAEDDYTESESPKSTPKKKGTLFGLPYIEVGIIAVVGVVIAIYIKDHMLSGSSSSPNYTLASNGTSPAVTSSGGSTSSGTSTSTPTHSSLMTTWLQDANNFATGIGMNSSTVDSALQNYTAGNTITSGSEATAIHSIINSIGAAPGLGSPTVKLASDHTSTKTTNPTTTVTTPQPSYINPGGTQQTSTVTDYLFSGKGTNNGVTTAVQGSTGEYHGSGYNTSTSSHYLALSNPNQADMARARGSILMYQPSPGVFKPAAGVNLAKGTTLFAET
jgi:hypothetical protein